MKISKKKLPFLRQPAINYQYEHTCQMIHNNKSNDSEIKEKILKIITYIC